MGNYNEVMGFVCVEWTLIMWMINESWSLATWVASMDGKAIGRHSGLGWSGSPRRSCRKKITASGGHFECREEGRSWGETIGKGSGRIAQNDVIINEGRRNATTGTNKNTTTDLLRRREHKPP